MMRSVHLRISALLLSLSSATYAQAPAPAEPAAAPVDPAAAPAEPAPAPAEPAPAEPAAAAAPVDPAAAAAPATPTPKRPLAAARRRAPPPPLPVASIQAPSLASSHPSLDLPEPEPKPAQPIPSIALWLGVGNLWIPSAGLDPFAKDDAFTTFSAGAGLSLARAGALDIAAVAGVDVTSSDADYRNESTSLGLLRLAAGPELRGSWLDRLYWHGRLAPTFTRLSLELDETSSGATLSDSQWLWGAEAALGLELRFAEATTELPHALGFFVRVDAGYAWTPSASVALQGDGSAPVRTQPLELGEIALSGPFLRAAVGIGL